MALRLGAENEPFGVINVGDDAKLVKLCEETGLATGELEFSGSLFHDINKPHSTVNVLIGVLGVYIGRIHEEVRARPTYLIARNRVRA